MLIVEGKGNLSFVHPGRVCLLTESTSDDIMLDTAREGVIPTTSSLCNVHDALLVLELLNTPADSGPTLKEH